MMYKHKETGKLYTLANHDTMVDLEGVEGDTISVTSNKFNTDFEEVGEPPILADFCATIVDEKTAKG